MSATHTETNTPTRKGETKIRHVRVGDETWVPAAMKANEEGMTISELIRDLLRDYNAGKRMV